MLVSSASVSFLKPTGLETRSVREITHEESSHGDRNDNGCAKDENWPGEQDPIAAAHGDSSVLATVSGL